MSRSSSPKTSIRKPPWLKRRLPSGPMYGTICQALDAQGLHTVCQEAKCPNQWECFSRQTATFLILGSRCTRNCGFCAVDHGPAGPPDPEEPVKVARMARDMALAYVVVTSVTRDDLPDGGAGLFAATIRALRDEIPGVRVEVLIPDLQGRREAIEDRGDRRAGCPEPQPGNDPGALSNGSAGSGLPALAGLAADGARPGTAHDDQIRSDAGGGGDP